MKIKITKCNDDFSWYKDYVNHTYTVQGINFGARFFSVKYVSEHQFESVSFDDAEVVELEGLPLNIVQQQLSGSDDKSSSSKVCPTCKGFGKVFQGVYDKPLTTCSDCGQTFR